jgi:hypothetical protein
LLLSLCCGTWRNEVSESEHTDIKYCLLQLLEDDIGGILRVLEIIKPSKEADFLK